MKPVIKINEIQWLHYFAIIINKISNLIDETGIIESLRDLLKLNGRPAIT
jgi:hypothetical protein